MKDIKVLGSGCKKCEGTADSIKTLAEELGQDVTIEKVTDTVEILGYGVMSTPAVVVDGTVVHAGGIPTASAIKEWLIT